MNPAGEPARCALHPVEPAVATCARCGNFMCATCQRADSRGLCPRCVELVGAPFPLSRQSWNFGALWDLAWARFKIDWMMLALGALVTFAISGTLNMAGQGVITGVAAAFKGQPWVMFAVLVPVQVAELVVNGGIQMGLVQLALDSLRGQKVDVARMFIPFRYLGRYVLLMLLIFAMMLPVMAVLSAVTFGPIFVGLGGLKLDPGAMEHHGPAAEILTALGVSAGVIGLLLTIFFLLVPLTFAVPELVARPETSVVTIVKNCFTITRDNRWSTMGVTFVATLVLVVGVLACCIGLLPAIGLQQLLVVGLYLTLRNGSDLPQSAFDTAAG